MIKLAVRLSLLAGFTLLSVGCSIAASTATAGPGPTTAATAAPAIQIPATSTPENATTQITIDGDPGDWQGYPANMTDLAEDQEENYPDILEGSFFKNDKYLYILINVGEQGEWTKLGIHFVTEGGGEGQLNIYQPFRAAIRGEAGSPLENVPVLFAQGESVEIKIALADLPGTIENIDALGFAISIDGADVYGDVMETAVLTLQTVDEPEAVSETQVMIDGDDKDWSQYAILVADAVTEVPSGAVDIVSVRAFNNDQYMYLAITQQDPTLFGKYAVVVRTDADQTPDFYIGLRPDLGEVVFGPFDAQSFAPVLGVEVSQGEIVEIKIPLALFGGLPVLYVHLQSEFNGPVADGIDFVPEQVNETETVLVLGDASPTLVSIDGEFDDWAPYAIALEDEPDDAINGGPDLSGMTVFVNDRYLYAKVDFAATGIWDDAAIGITFQDGSQGQINLKDIYVSWFTFHGEEERFELPVEFEYSDSGLELKVELARLPAPLITVNGFAFYNHAGGFGNNPLDEVNGGQPAPIVNEFEP